MEARLAQLLTEGTSPHPRWLIRIDGRSEEIYEHLFERVLVAADDSADAGNSDPAHFSAHERDNESAAPGKTTASTTGKRSASNKNSGSGDEGSKEARESGRSDDEEMRKENNENNSKKSVSFSNESSANGSEGSETGDTSAAGRKVSAREQRSRKRQAMIDEHGGNFGVLPPANGKRRPPQNNKSKAKRMRPESDEECVKIKLLTGTLYLYRGRHRRAEFVRRV